MANGWRSYFTEKLSKHTWIGDKILLQSSATVDTMTKLRVYEIEAQALGLNRGGWLEAAVNCASNPMHTPDAYAVARLISLLADNPSYRAYLETPVPLLQPENVIGMFDGVDSAAETTAPRSAIQYSQRVRHFLSRPTASLATGDLIRDVRFYTSLKTPVGRPRNTLSDRPHPGIKDSELAKPASAIGFTDLEDLHLRQVAHFEGRNRVLVESCVTVLDSHDFVVESIRAARKIKIGDLDLPAPLCDHILDKKKIPQYGFAQIPSEAVLPLCVYLMDANEFYANHQVIRLPTHPIEAFAPLQITRGHREQFGLLLSEFYLSANVYAACLVLLMLETGWNSSTVLSLTKDRIEEVDGIYYLHGYKTKSDQNQSAEIPSGEAASEVATPPSDTAGLVSKLNEDDDPDKPHQVESPTTTRAITLLQKHRANIDQYWKTETQQLFLLMSLKPKDGDSVFRVPDISELTRQFCDFIEHPRFLIDDIRNQRVNTRYARTRDLRQAQADLGHANAGTTLIYINGEALRHSKEATIKDFADILSDAYLYSAGRLVVNPEAKGRKSRLTRTLLLFPPSSLHAEDGESIADRWLNSRGNFSFQIGDDEIAYCIYQRRYYRTHCAKLASANLQKFQKYHLPRIIFCEALYQFIAGSPLGNKLKRLEGEQS